jgi:ATP-dependent DNA helicase RecQ
MGLLKDYTIDYNKNNLYHCRLVKYSDVNVYVGIIQEYLKRYLSENSAKRKIKILKESLTHNDLVEDVITCLNFLADFSFEEIASKRKRATDEIENTLVSAIKFSNDFAQNIYLKEQIYFYFNAKYARIGFKIEGEPYSLIDDFKAETLDKPELLFKYLNVFQKDKGSEQNTYQHMIGSCKKILRSLVQSDFEKDWMLRLIKAFAMYAVNNPSYISEANEDLEKGFENLYLDTNTHQDNFTIIYGIFKAYKEILVKNIDPKNKSFFDIQLILMNILIKLQSRGIEKLISTNTQLVDYHA